MTGTTASESRVSRASIFTMMTNVATSMRPEEKILVNPRL